MKSRLPKFSIQKKMILLMSAGAIGFLIYFAANFVISRNNQKLMSNLVDVQLPLLEKSEGLSLNLGSIKTLLTQNSISIRLDGTKNLEVINEKVATAFSDLKKFSGARITDLSAVKQKYNETYQAAHSAIQKAGAGRLSDSAAQIILNQSIDEISLIEIWAIKLKEHEAAELRASIDSANDGSRRAMAAGWLLILAGIPFAVYFFFNMREITTNLQSVSLRLAEVVQAVLGISDDASVSSSRLASASEQQATAVTESVSSIEEMKSMLGQTVKHSAEALNSSEESFREAASGQQTIDELKSAMLDIERAYAELEEVNTVVSSIRSKTNIINDIVFKTQLLSFNASIEAARAGQHGRGFSVVASEVGKLAEMSGLAAQEIGKLLDHSSKKVAEIVLSTKGKVESANEMSQKCATVFERITSRTAEVKSMVDAITSAAAEQENGIQQASRSMLEMQDSADQSDKMAHDISHLSESLKGQSEALASTLHRLEHIVLGQPVRNVKSAKVEPFTKKHANKDQDKTKSA